MPSRVHVVANAPQPVVWIVDDAISVRKSIGAVLETADIVVRDCGSAAEFLASFTHAQASCLVVDHHMPDMSGLDLLLHLRKEGITIPVIVMTGAGDSKLREKALTAGAVTMLHKPVDGDELVALIESLILAGSRMTECLITSATPSPK